MTIPVITSADPVAEPAVLALKAKLSGPGPTARGGLDVPAIVRQIIDDVQARGDAALIDWEAKLDGASPTASTIRVSTAALAEARRQADPEFLAIIRRAADNIRAYQQSIRVADPKPLVRGGRKLSLRYTPIDRAGLYVPGGRAIYPSSMLMTIIPAQVAGVKQIAIASPPRQMGLPSGLVLAVAAELGVTEVYALGGAVAIAALAIGAASVPKVDKILGPGNAFVAEAKRQVFGRVGIDSVAGPSEVLIVADETATPAWVAADMLAQAEHDPGSAILATPSAGLARAVAAELQEQIPRLERADAIRAALDNQCAIIVTPSLEAAFDVANFFAAEHLQLIVADTAAALARIRHAGAIFLGPYSPVPLGDYYAGPSHVLPTGGTARFFGPLSCNDFLKASSVVSYDEASLAADAPDVADFATREGLTAHANAIRIRQHGRK